MVRTLLNCALVLILASGCSSATGEGEQSAAKRPRVQPSSAARDAAAAVGDWPRWRGPNLDGISREQGWKHQWDAPPPELWKTSLGTGFSSLAIQSGKLYTMGHVGEDDFVYCFDADTGATIWKYSYPCKLVDNLHEGGPAATPTVDGPLVYTLSKEGHLFALGADSGEVDWKRELQQDLELSMPAWGFSSSPLVWRDLLIIEAGRIAAYNKNTGDLVWKTEAHAPGYGSAVSFRHGDDDLIASLNNEVLLVVRAADGAEVAKTEWKTDYATSANTPIVAGDTIFISTGYNTGCALFRLGAGKLEQVYAHKEMRNHMNNCVLWQGFLYGFDGNAHQSRNVTVTCMDQASGEVKWKERGLGCGSLMMADGKLILLSDSGELVIAEASPEAWRPLSRAQILAGKCWTVPVLAGGRIYARNADGDLVCVDLRK